MQRDLHLRAYLTVRQEGPRPRLRVRHAMTRDDWRIVGWTVLALVIAAALSIAQPLPY